MFRKLIRASLFAALGSMAIQGPVLKWVAIHRRHHQHSDEPEDPHSPHHSGRGVLGLIRGFWHSHVGWAFSGGTANPAFAGEPLPFASLDGLAFVPGDG